MAGHDRGGKLRIDADGVRTVDTGGIRPQVWMAVGALFLAVLALLIWMRRPYDSTAEPVARAENGAAARDPATRREAAPQRREPIQRVAAIRPRRAPREHLAENGPAKRAEAAGDENAAANQTDEDAPTGIALFPPPGTDPIKRGIIVPEGFELPPGYVRHYQVTDDGKPLAAILMFHPDYEFVDAQGVAIEIPADRVVPPDMAPPGLPIEMLDVPKTDAPMVEPEKSDAETQP
jgi:hypothetical protein